MEDLKTGASWQAFGEELTQQVASAFVGTDQRCCRQNEPFGPRIEVKPGFGNIDTVRQIVREHIEHERWA